MSLNRRVTSDPLQQQNSKYQPGDYFRMPHSNQLSTVLRVGKPYWSSIHNCAMAGTLVVQPLIPQAYTGLKPLFFNISTLENHSDGYKENDHSIRGCNV